MKKRYPNCERKDGLCGICSLVNRGRDCHNNPVNKILWQRSLAEFTQAMVAEKTGINIRQYQKYESGECGAENMTLKNAIALADLFECDVRELL